MTPVPAWLQPVLSLLSTSTYQCLTCGKRGQPSKFSPEICVQCAALIPWIRFPRCSKCGRHVGCPDCTRGTEQSPIVCNRSAVAYNSAMREWLGQYKYRGNERYAPLLGIMLEKAYQMLKEQQMKLQTDDFSKKNHSRLFSSAFHRSPSTNHWKADLLVPVPVSNSRLGERGFNQAERLSSELSGRTGIPIQQLLIRTHHTDKQSFKGRSERLINMKDAFGPNLTVVNHYTDWLRVRQIRPVRIIIVDDIYTTGSTIRACAESIRQMTDTLDFSCEVYSLTWARS